MLINNKSLIKTINQLNLTDDEREKFNKISEDDNGNFIYNGKPVIGGATAEQVAQIEANRTAIGDSNSGLIKEINNIKNTELQNLNTAILGVNETLGDKTRLPSGDANIIASINRIDSSSAKTTDLNNKVDKVEGKTLTTNDYTNEEKQTVASLKVTIGDTSSGLVKDVKDLKTNSVSQDNINSAIEKYMQDNPVQSGATTEQAAQIQANKTAIQTVNETIGNKNELPVGDANIIASINRIDSKTSTGGTGLTSEQEAKLNSIDNKVDKIDGKGLSTEDFTTEEKTTLANLKTTIGDNSSGLVKDVVDLKTNGVSQDNINSAVKNYLIENPIEVSDKYKISLDWWNPPSQPNTWANTTMKSEEFLSTFFDTYITNDSDTTTDYTFKKTSLGKEASRIYDIYEYIFTPNNYNRTIMISSIMHGIEIVGGFSVGRLLYYIINEPDVHELIRYIRDNVRIIFMPMLNPYGFDQTPRKFGNYNGVNINSNFDDGGWDNYVEDSYNMKGVAPLSEPEARIISEQLKKYQYELDFWIDCHTGAGWDHDVWMYYIDEDEIFKPKVIRAGEWETQQYIIDKGCSESDLKNRIMDADTSHKLRYAYKNFGVSCSTPEYVPRRFGGDFNGSNDLKAYLRHLCGLLVSGLNTEDWNKEKIKGNGIKSKKNTETSNSTNTSSNYIILNSPDGTEYKITVSNDGIISAKLAKMPLISAIGNISYTDGSETDSTSTVRTDYIKCVNNDTMSYSLDSKYKMVGRYYDSSKKFLGISGSTFVSGNGKFTLLNNTAYVRLVIKNIYETDFTSDNLIKEIALDGQKYTLTYGNPGNPPESNNIILNKQKLNMNVSDTYQLNATLNGTNINSTATWSADNDNVSVLNGLVTANLVGTSTITVSMENKNSATCLVNVTEKTEADIVCELGTITSADGLEKDATTYIRTSFLPVTVTDKITISKTTSLYYLIRCYDENKRYRGAIPVQKYFKGTNDGNGWAISDGDWSGPLINSTVKYVRLVFTKQDGTDFTSSDIDGSETITVNGSEYSIKLNI